MLDFNRMTDGAGQLQKRIHRILEHRSAMHVDELRMRLDVDGAVMRETLEAMLARGEVERLRPVACAREDHDFFRVNRPAPVAAPAEERHTAQAARDGRQRVQLAGVAMVWLVD